MLRKFLLHGDLGFKHLLLPEVYHAAGCYSNGVEGLILQSYNLDTSTIKGMLVKSAYTYDPDHDFVNDVSSSESDATGYTGGFAGADRLTFAITITEQTANNRVVAIPEDKTWTAIGGATNNTLASLVLIFEITNDGASLPIVYLEFTGNLTTNGSDILVNNDDTNGNIRFTV